LFIAESPNVIARALAAGYEPLTFLIDTEYDTGQVQQITAGCPEAAVYLAEPTVMQSVRGLHLTRGVLCAMRRKKAEPDEDLLRQASRIAVLENVMNPTNLGAIFRSAAALGVDAVLLTRGCTDPLYRRAARVSMGTVFQVPWYQFPEAPIAADLLKKLSGFGFRSAAMALCDDSVSIDDPAVRSAEKLAVVLGTEGEGLSPETIAACNWTVRIPMAHNVDSLNVAAASAVAFWALRRKV
jgi:tRNA G18 (ribose-2'-O)-methylase SpoU